MGGVTPIFRPRFQSAPHPKVRRNLSDVPIAFAMDKVSIRSSPEGEEKLTRFFAIFSVILFQSAPHPKVRRNATSSMDAALCKRFNPLLTRR